MTVSKSLAIDAGLIDEINEGSRNEELEALAMFVVVECIVIASGHDDLGKALREISNKFDLPGYWKKIGQSFPPNSVDMKFVPYTDEDITFEE